MVNVTLFGQIIRKLDRYSFKKIVDKYESDKHHKGINSWTHLVSMLFCHFSKANSLREISNGLRSATGNLNHLGVSLAPSKSSLSYINMHRNWEVFRDYYFALLKILSKDVPFQRIKFKSTLKKIFILDSTTITLCLSVFDWARYRQTKGAIKLHMLLDYDSCLPTYVCMTDGKFSDVRIAQQLKFPPDSLVVMDRAYLDFGMLYQWHQDKVKFVIRLKKNIMFKRRQEYALPENEDQHILVDELISLSPFGSGRQYPEKLRRVVVWDDVNKQTIEIITNQFTWTAATIAELYKQRWQIEIFFKTLKQLLKIKTFVGTSENAVLIQIWTALITILLLKYLKQLAKYDWCLSNLVAFLRMNLFVKIDLQKWLDKPFEPLDPTPKVEQLSLL
ncbi:MAG: IS4 family transposase [Fidelibacterota bacterium]